MADVAEIAKEMQAIVASHGRKGEIICDIVVEIDGIRVGCPAECFEGRTAKEAALGILAAWAERKTEASFVGALAVKH